DRQHAAEVAFGLAEPSHPVVRRAEQVERDGDVRVVGTEAADVLLEQAQARGLRAREIAALQRLLRLVEELARAGVVDLARRRGFLLGLGLGYRAFTGEAENGDKNKSPHFRAAIARSGCCRARSR